MTIDLETNYDAETNTPDVEKIKNRCRSSKMRQTTYIWIKRILDEAIWIVDGWA